MFSPLGAYIFFGTLFELFGFQGHRSQRPLRYAPGAVVRRERGDHAGSTVLPGDFFRALAGNGLRGIGSALKEISLLISMSFRLFGALLSGLLVTELVYYYAQLSFVLPVAVAVLFTLLLH